MTDNKIRRNIRLRDTSTFIYINVNTLFEDTVDDICAIDHYLYHQADNIKSRKAKSYFYIENRMTPFDNFLSFPPKKNIFSVIDKLEKEKRLFSIIFPTPDDRYFLFNTDLIEKWIIKHFGKKFYTKKVDMNFTHDNWHDQNEILIESLTSNYSRHPFVGVRYKIGSDEYPDWATMQRFLFEGEEIISIMNEIEKINKLPKKWTQLGHWKSLYIQKRNIFIHIDSIIGEETGKINLKDYFLPKRKITDDESRKINSDDLKYYYKSLQAFLQVKPRTHALEVIKEIEKEEKHYFLFFILPTDMTNLFLLKGMTSWLRKYLGKNYTFSLMFLGTPNYVIYEEDIFIIESENSSLSGFDCTYIKLGDKQCPDWLAVRNVLFKTQLP